jgi:Putative zinc-finger
MSGNTQLDLHPDAESLSAFAENALADQERERIMAHLAMCGRCREVVFLAHDAVEEMEPALVAAAAPAPGVMEPARWYKSRRLMWIPVAALAASVTVAYVIHIRRLEPATQVAQVEKQTAAVSEVTQATPPPTPEESAKSVGVPGKKAPVGPRDVISSETSPQAATPPTAAQVANAPEVALQNSAQAVKDAASELKSIPQNSAAANEVAQNQKERTEVHGEMQALVANGRALTSMDKLEQAQKEAAAPMRQAEAAPRSTAGKGGVERGLGGSLVAYWGKPVALPSGLAVVSTATAQELVLAVDKAGSMFLSSDSGAHWDSVGRQWTGHVVTVRAVTQAKTGAAAGGGTQKDLFELVNDQGEVWVSADGRNWKAK